MAHRGILVAWVAGAVLLAGTSRLAGQNADPLAVRGRLLAYLTDYESQLGRMVADEQFTQWPHSRPGYGTGRSDGISRDETRPRILHSTVAFVPLPGNAGWLGYREVRTVNGKPTSRSGLPLEALLQRDSEDGRERALALLLEGARHNLGAPRTINLPSLALEMLHRRNEARFVVVGSGRERAGDCAAVRIDLVETVRPTLIRGREGGDMPTRLSAWVEPATGRLCRTEARTRDGQLGAWFEAVVRVDFAHDPTIDLTVPVRLYEVFFDPPRHKGDGEAVYSNYRRMGGAGMPRQIPGPPA